MIFLCLYLYALGCVLAVGYALNVGKREIIIVLTWPVSIPGIFIYDQARANWKRFSKKIDDLFDWF